MSLTVFNTNTATSPATGTRTINPPPINFGSDFRVASESANEVILSNILTPINAPETIRIAISEVNDVFKGTRVTKLDSNEGQTPNARGVSLLVQLNGTGEDSNATGVYYPWSANIVLKVPVGPAPGESDVIAMLTRLLGTLYDTSATSMNTRIASMVRGALAPKEL